MGGGGEKNKGEWRVQRGGVKGAALLGYHLIHFTKWKGGHQGVSGFEQWGGRKRGKPGREPKQNVCQPPPYLRGGGEGKIIKKR